MKLECEKLYLNKEKSVLLYYLLLEYTFPHWTSQYSLHRIPTEVDRPGCKSSNEQSLKIYSRKQLRVVSGKAENLSL